jgi:hypothetical protein
VLAVEAGCADVAVPAGGAPGCGAGRLALARDDRQQGRQEERDETARHEAIHWLGMRANYPPPREA